MKWSRILLSMVFIGLVSTGIALYIIAPDDEWAMPHELNGPLRTAHGWLMLLSLLVVGTFLSEHVVKKWRKVSKHPDGLLHLLTWFALIISGGFLYYPLASWPQTLPMKSIHWYCGVVLISVFILHVGRYYLSQYRNKQPRASR
jgi:hypothetical protein